MSNQQVYIVVYTLKSVCNEVLQKMIKTISIKDKETIKELHKIRTEIGLKYFVEVINFLIKKYKDMKGEIKNE